MLTILNSLNAHNFPIFQPILMILVSKFMVHRALSDKAYLSLGLLSPLSMFNSTNINLNSDVDRNILRRNIRLPTTWYLRQAKAQTSLCVRAV